jgi:electron transport complex protein RnfC
MIEEADRLVIGCRILLRLVDDARVLIGIEDNKPEAIQAVRKAAEGVDRVEVRVLKTKYPQGSEKQLIVALTKREVPSGGLPSDIGCIVQNIDTVIAIHRAIVRGRPLMRKVVTLTGGAIRNPGNYKIRLGTKVSDIIDMIGGFTCTPAKVIVGGPMMGTAIFDIDVPVVKTTAGMLFLTEDEARVPPEEPCIHCARCVEHCPIGLLPLELNADVLADRNEAFVKHNGIDCIECGCCSYVCPSKRRLAQSIRMARRLELAKRRKK